MDDRHDAPEQGPRPGLILDRDGVITENREDYIRTWADVAFCRGSLEAMAAIAKLDIRTAIVSNQSVVGRGLLSLPAALDLNQRIVQALTDYGGRIDGVYICPHHPDVGCTCRKPQPGLITQAAAELDLDLGHSILIGDALSDLQAGFRAGVGRLVLVRTGRGAAQEEKVREAALPSLQVFENLQEAAQSLFPSIV